VDPRTGLEDVEKIITFSVLGPNVLPSYYTPSIVLLSEYPNTRAGIIIVS
jgi:hypothetical protein